MIPTHYVDKMSIQLSCSNPHAGEEDQPMTH